MSQPVPTAAGAVRVSVHAIDRYVERVKPAYTPQHAHWELARLLPQAELAGIIPGWIGPTTYENTDRYETDCFLVLCESLVFPIFDSIVLTTLVRGSMAPVARYARNEARKRRHSRHRAQKISERQGINRRQRKAQDRPDDWRREQAA